MKRLAVLAALAAGLTLQASVAFGQQAPDASNSGTQTSAPANQTNQAGSTTGVPDTLVYLTQAETNDSDHGNGQNDEPKSK
jgi:hypothetical protein